MNYLNRERILQKKRASHHWSCVDPVHGLTFKKVNLKSADGKANKTRIHIKSRVAIRSSWPWMCILIPHLQLLMKPLVMWPRRSEHRQAESVFHIKSHSEVLSRRRKTGNINTTRVIPGRALPALAAFGRGPDPGAELLKNRASLIGSEGYVRRVTVFSPLRPKVTHLESYLSCH